MAIILILGGDSYRFLEKLSNFFYQILISGYELNRFLENSSVSPILEYWGMTPVDFWKAYPYLVRALDEFSRIRLIPERRIEIVEIFGGVFQDKLPRICQLGLNMVEIIFLDRRSRIVNWIINRRSFDKCQILLIIIIILLCKIISDIQDQNHQQQNRVSQQFEQSSVDQIGKFSLSGLFPVQYSSITGGALPCE